jgi:hypothetical protein
MNGTNEVQAEGRPLPTPAPKRGVWEWFWRGHAIRNVRGYRTTLPLLEQTRLTRALRAAELAERAYDPIDPLRAGSAMALAVSLYREAAFWALACQDSSFDGATLKQLFQQVPRELLLLAADGPERLTDVELALVGRDFVATAELSPELTKADADVSRAFVQRLIELKVGPEKRTGRLLLQRYVRTLGALALFAACVVGAVLWYQRATLKPDLAAGRPWRASSSLETCRVQEHYCASAHTDIFFHTLEEKQPWVEIDLGKPTAFSLVEVTNRSDCCPDRAVPLVIEVGNGQQQWREVARRTDTFSKWRAKIAPTTARYVRLRVTRRSLLHLEKVVVRGS